MISLPPGHFTERDLSTHLLCSLDKIMLSHTQFCKCGS